MLLRASPRIETGLHVYAEFVSLPGHGTTASSTSNDGGRTQVTVWDIGTGTTTTASTNTG